MSVRLSGDWISAVDDRLLEFLESEGSASVSTIDEGEYVRYLYETIGRRLRLLLNAELVKKIGQGVYRISDRGQGYLAGVEDLRDEPDPE